MRPVGKDNSTTRAKELRGSAALESTVLRLHNFNDHLSVSSQISSRQQIIFKSNANVVKITLNVAERLEGLMYKQLTDNARRCSTVELPTSVDPPFLHALSSLQRRIVTRL